MTVLSLGIDLGTSGIRSAVVDASGNVLATARADYGKFDPDQIDARVWWKGVVDCLKDQVNEMLTQGIDVDRIDRIAVDGTSGTMVLTDANLTPVTSALMYNSGGFEAEAERISSYAPIPHITRGTASALARMMRLQAQDAGEKAAYLLHQADFISAKLMGQGGYSDHNNALKTGFDPEVGIWPSWAKAAGVRTDLLPRVAPVGQALSVISKDVAALLGLPPTITICAGTTDSIAAFLACAPLKIGAAVTSLGTTLAVKMLSPKRIDAPEIGLYSHRLGDHWLVGGASNTGGGVLRHFFNVDQLETLSQQIDPSVESPLDYYPLLKVGERFPINDPNLAPRLAPRPESDVDFLHGLFESMARIEARCYASIANLGAEYPRVIHTAGGGSANKVWSAIRSRVIGARIERPDQTEAAVGTAKLAMSALCSFE